MAWDLGVRSRAYLDLLLMVVVVLDMEDAVEASNPFLIVYATSGLQQRTTSCTMEVVGERLPNCQIA